MALEDSILKSTKKVLNVDPSDTSFDLDIIIHINAVFVIIMQLGIGPPEGFMIEDDTEVWDTLDLPLKQLNLIRTYLFLQVRMLFDPPATSFHIEAMKNQISELEHRLSWTREEDIAYPLYPVVVEEVV